MLGDHLLFVSLSSPARLLCSLFVLGSPLVGLLNGAFRSLCLILVYIVFFFCCSALFLLETPDLRWARFFFSFFPSVLVLSSSLVPCCCRCSVCLSLVLFVVALRRVVSFLFLAGVAVCFVCSFCGGCAWGVLCFLVTACQTCASLAARCPRSMQPPSVFSFFVPSSCLVACRRSSLWYGFFLGLVVRVGTWLVPACFVLVSVVCV